MPDTSTMKLRDAAEEFLAQRRIAVNPATTESEGDPCFAAVTDIPGGVDGVVIVTPAAVSASVVADCAAAGVPRVWLHRGMGPGSLSDDAVQACHDHGIAVIPGGCPNMFGATSDRGHRGMLHALQMTGKVPRRLPVSAGPS